MSAEHEPISPTSDVIDSRDVIARITYLESEWDDAAEDDHADYTLSEDDWAVHLGEEAAHELLALKELAEEGANNLPDWPYGETLVHEDHFEDYAQELAESVGAISPNAEWPLTYIDWARAADALRVDYTEVTYDGQTYLARA